MKSPVLRKYGSWGARTIGSCLIVSALLRPELGLLATSFLADLFMGQPFIALDALMWVLTVIAGVGLIAVRRWACFLVYTAFLYSLFPRGPEFVVFPVEPLLQVLLGEDSSAYLQTMLLLNGAFVILVISVHAALAKTSEIRTTKPAAIALLSTSAIAVLLVVTAPALLLMALRKFTPATDRFTALIYMIILGVPLAVWGTTGFVVACLRLWSIRRIRLRASANGNAAADGPTAPTALPGNTASRFRFSFPFLVAVAVFICIHIGVFVSMYEDANDPMRYQRRFRATTASADRIVVRDGGYDCCGPVVGQKILFEITDERELKEVRNNLRFEPGESFSACMCCGYPGIDWYRGNRRIALTGVQHMHSLRWKGFPGDAYLTEESSQWLGQWLKRHGLDDRRLH